MCGRFAFIPDKTLIKTQYPMDWALDMPPQYNSAPGAKVVFITYGETGEMMPLRLQWGLIPFWSKDNKSSRMIINARAETLFEKPAFRQPIQSKRGIMLMSGFFEWKTQAEGKRPFYVTSKHGEYLSVAAIRDTWQSGDEVVHSCCLITTSANSLMRPIHERMPVLLTSEQLPLWMDNAHYNPSDLKALLNPYPKSDLMCFPVTPKMNQSSYTLPDAIERIDL